MGRIGLVLSVVDLVLTVVAVVDIVLIDPSRVRALPKWVWVVVVLVLFLVGPLLWFFVGHEQARPLGPARVAPDDDPEFLRRLGEQRDHPDDHESPE